MKNNKPPNNGNPEHLLFKVVHLENPEDTLTAIRHTVPLYKKTPMDSETLRVFLQVATRYAVLPSESEMRAALEKIQPPPLRSKKRLDYKAQHALQRLACGETVRVTGTMFEHMAPGMAQRLRCCENIPGTYSLPFAHCDILAAFLALLVDGWGFPPVGETGFKGWPRIYATPFGGWGEDEGSEFYDH